MGLTACSAVASMILCGLLISNSRQIRTMQIQIAGINQNRAIATSLVNELANYSKTNPDPSMRAILQSLAPKPAAQQPASTQQP